MAKLSLRRFDVQARVAISVAIASVVFVLAQGALILRADQFFRYIDIEQKVIYYGPRCRAAIWILFAVTMVLAGTAFGFGYNSAGERRNDRQRLSWLAFFISAGVISLSIILFMLFRLRGESEL